MKLYHIVVLLHVYMITSRLPYAYLLSGFALLKKIVVPVFLFGCLPLFSLIRRISLFHLNMPSSSNLTCNITVAFLCVILRTIVFTFVTVNTVTFSLVLNQ